MIAYEVPDTATSAPVAPEFVYGGSPGGRVPRWTFYGPLSATVGISRTLVHPRSRLPLRASAQLNL